MFYKEVDSSSDAYIALKDHVDNCSAMYVQAVARQLIETSRNMVATVSLVEDSSVYFTLFFDRLCLGKCVVHLGRESPVSVALSWSDIGYLAATDTEFNKAVSLLLADSLLKQVSKVGVLWIGAGGKSRDEAA